MKRNATPEQRQEIDEALQPPVTARDPDGTPTWYGSDDDAWSAFTRQAGARSVGLG